MFNKHAKKSRTTFYDFNEVTFGSPAFRLYGIRDFLSLPYDRFGVVAVEHKKN